MLLLVGLGNPGREYTRTRHNVGFMAVQEIAERHRIGAWRRRFHGLACEGPISGERVLLLLPGTFMNDSGRAVAEAASYNGITLDKIIVFHDEIELHPAYVRVKTGGGNAGHNGLRSISSCIGNNYRRVCIGVGRPPIGETVEHYALRNFESREYEWLAPLLRIISDEVDSLVRDGEKIFEDRVQAKFSAAGFGRMLQYSSSRPKRAKDWREPPTDR